MRETDVQYLVCHRCDIALAFRVINERREGRVHTATLQCPACAAAYPVIRGIPRFVPNENYASSFGLQWTRHARTQYDSHRGLWLSEQRFCAETRWPRDLSGRSSSRSAAAAGGSPSRRRRPARSSCRRTTATRSTPTQPAQPLTDRRFSPTRFAEGPFFGLRLGSPSWRRQLTPNRDTSSLCKAALRRHSGRGHESSDQCGAARFPTVAAARRRRRERSARPGVDSRRLKADR